MYPSATAPLRRARRANSLVHRLSAPFGHVPSRVFAHLLVVVVCLSVAYVGRTSSLVDRPESASEPSAVLQPSAFTTASPPQVDAVSLAPGLAPPGSAAQRGEIIQYRAQTGDTVSALADRFDISENTIRWTNNLPANADPAPGQPLVILPVSGVLYTVQSGDTIDAIAQRFQTDRASILQVNPVANASPLRPGLSVIIPGGRPADAAGPVSASDPPSVLVAEREHGDASAVQTAPIPAPEATVASPRSDPLFRIPYLERFLPRPATAAPKPLTPIVYRVSPGETLSSIARKFGVSSDSIAFSSGIQSSADSLTVDQKLIIPPVPGVVHVVQDGDTLESIARRYSADPAAIARANQLSDPFVLQVGKSLIVPDATVAAAAPAPTPSASYTVQEGDSLVAIADNFGLDVHSVINANGLADPYVLQPGQQLTIPVSAVHVHAPTVHGTASDTSSSSASVSTAAGASTAPTVSEAPIAVPAVSHPAPPAPRPTVAARAPSRAAAASSGGWSIVSTASKFLGYPYVWGGTSPGAGFDCSGFVYYVYRAAGNPVPRDMWGQLQSGAHVSMSNLQPGDIVFFANTYQAGLSHDGIYIGGGRFIHAADYGIGVEVSSLSNAYYANHYYSASRPE